MQFCQLFFMILLVMGYRTMRYYSLSSATMTLMVWESCCAYMLRAGEFRPAIHRVYGTYSVNISFLFFEGICQYSYYFAQICVCAYTFAIYLGQDM